MGEDEFRTLYVRLSGKIFSFAARRLSPEAAKDVVSETFEVVWIKHQEAPSGEDAQAAWIFGIAKNKVLQANQRRTRKHHDHRYAEDFPHRVPASADIADGVVDGALGVAIYGCLTPAEQLLFDVVFVRNMDRDTAAALLDIRVGTLNTRISRLRSRILALELELTAEPETMSEGVV